MFVSIIYFSSCLYVLIIFIISRKFKTIIKKCRLNENTTIKEQKEEKEYGVNSDEVFTSMTYAFS